MQKILAVQHLHYIADTAIGQVDGTLLFIKKQCSLILHLTVEAKHPCEGKGHSEGYYVDQNVQGQLLIEVEQRARNAGDRHTGGSQAYQLMGSSPEPYLLHSLDTGKYRTLIAQIFKLEGTATERYFKGNGLLLQVLGELFRDAGFDERNWGKSSVADEVKFYLDVNYSEKLRLKDVAHNFGVHPNYLTRVFHEKYHVSPKQYLLNLKLQKACQLLHTTELPVAVIANSMGFDDSLAFSKLFKKTYDFSPSHYRGTDTDCR